MSTSLEAPPVSADARTSQNYQDVGFRRTALDFAVNGGDAYDRSTKTVLKNAAKYYAFLKGETNDGS